MAEGRVVEDEVEEADAGPTVRRDRTTTSSRPTVASSLRTTTAKAMEWRMRLRPMDRTTSNDSSIPMRTRPLLHSRLRHRTRCCRYQHSHHFRRLQLQYIHMAGKMPMRLFRAQQRSLLVYTSSPLVRISLRQARTSSRIPIPTNQPT